MKTPASASSASDKPRPRFFISYCIDDKRFVREVCNLLRPYIGQDNMFLFEDHPDAGCDFRDQIDAELARSNCLIVFQGRRFGPYQDAEVAAFAKKEKGAKEPLAAIAIGLNHQRKEADFHERIHFNLEGRPHLVDEFTMQTPEDSVGCAIKIWNALEPWMREHHANFWKPWDDATLLHGLPNVPQLFDYEKTIIEFYAAKELQERKRANGGDIPEGISKTHVEQLSKHWPDELIEQMLDNGVTAEWPKVQRYAAQRANRLNPKHAGDFRADQEGDEALVRVAALVDLDPLRSNPTFPEAGPRPSLAFPHRGQQLHAAILVAGGIAPGINAVIDAIVQRHNAYKQASLNSYRLQVFGVKNGFLAMGGINAALHNHLKLLEPQDTIENATQGGSMLGTSRDEKLLDPSTRHQRLEQIANALERRNIDILYVIGGDGGMKAAHALWHAANRDRPPNRKMAVVAIPKTMDNDILWVWQSFGFLSAVDEARRIVETLHTEVHSNPRLGIVQLFGSDSGFVVSHAVLAAAAGHTMLALIPEIQFSALGVARYLKRRLWESANPDLPSNAPSSPIDPKLPHGLVVLAENAIPQDVMQCLGLADEFPAQFEQSYREIAQQLPLTPKEQEEIRTFAERQKAGQRIEGQTSDIIRKLGLSVMAKAIPVFLKREDLLSSEDCFGWDEPDWSKLRVVCSEPRHLVRSLQPSTSDIITGQRLGLLAVDAAMAGYTDCMISQWLTEFAIVPLDLVVLGRKRIPHQGMFWKSVISKTGQAQDLVSPFGRNTKE